MEATLDDLERELWLRRRNSGELVWKTREGEAIPVKDMSDKHLENAIRCVIRETEMIDRYYSNPAFE